MQKWEYLQVDMSLAEDGEVELLVENNQVRFQPVCRDKGQKMYSSQYLEKLGQDGWELVNGEAVNGGYKRYYIFKRPLVEATDSASST